MALKKCITAIAANFFERLFLACVLLQWSLNQADQSPFFTKSSGMIKAKSTSVDPWIIAIQSCI